MINERVQHTTRLPLSLDEIKRQNHSGDSGKIRCTKCFTVSTLLIFEEKHIFAVGEQTSAMGPTVENDKKAK